MLLNSLYIYIYCISIYLPICMYVCKYSNTKENRLFIFLIVYVSQAYSFVIYCTTDYFSKKKREANHGAGRVCLSDDINGNFLNFNISSSLNTVEFLRLQYESLTNIQPAHCCPPQPHGPQCNCTAGTVHIYAPGYIIMRSSCIQWQHWVKVNYNVL